MHTFQTLRQRHAGLIATGGSCADTLADASHSAVCHMPAPHVCACHRARARATWCHEHAFAAARELHPSLAALWTPALLQTGRTRWPDPRARLPHTPVSCPRRTRSCQRSCAAEYDLTIISPPTSRVQWIGWRVSACERKCVWPARKTHLWQPLCCCSAAVTLPACRTGAHVCHQHLRVRAL